MINYLDKDLIQKSLDNELTEVELAHFQEKFANDPDFAEEVMQYLEIRAALRAAKKVQQAYRQDSPVKSMQVSWRKKYKNYLVAASVSLLALIGTAIMVLNRPSGHERLYTAYYQPYTSKVNVRNLNDSDINQGSQMDKALIAYQAKKYSESIQHFEEVLALEPQNITAFFYAAQCYLNIGQTDKAIVSLEGVVKGAYNTYTQDAAWYLTLAYLKKGELENCRGQLQEIMSKNGFYKKRAQQLLQQLE